jgi:hypothetical protein
MTPVYTTMIGAWNVVEEVQQGCSSRGGGLKQFKFEPSSESRSSAQ